MELLKHGKFGNSDEWKQNATCEKFDRYDTEGCGAEYSVEAGDLVLRYFKGTHFRHYYTAIRCLECNKHTRVHNVPPPILSQVLTPDNKKGATFDGFED